MRDIACVYDVSSLSKKEKEDVIKYLEYQYSATYNYEESYGTISRANYISSQTFSGGYYETPVSVVITSPDIDTVREYWDYRGKINKWCQPNNIGGM